MITYAILFIITGYATSTGEYGWAMFFLALSCVMYGLDAEFRSKWV
jgi:hypothetical protein